MLLATSEKASLSFVMSDKQKSEKVSALCYAPSKWYQWLALNVELEKVELISTSTAHMRPFTRQNAAAFKFDMDESEFASSSMKSLCIFVGTYIEEIAARSDS